MTAHDPSLSRSHGGLLGWLGFGSRHVDEAGNDETVASPGDRRDAHRHRQLDDIGAFLSHHRLEVNAQTLGVAYSYLSGSDPDLARQIDRRIQSRQLVTIEWLDEVTQSANSEDDLTALTQLLARLENSIDEFGKTSSAARKATSEYNSALAAHVDELEQVNRAGAVISELATITKAMVKRTHDIEQQMHRSEAQTKALKRRLDETRRSAEEDHLTGLPNRRAFEARFEEEYRQAHAALEPMSVAFCDIDHFKRINDLHGHDAGDRVLKIIAESLAQISDDRCHVARHGGEEFVMLFRDTTPVQALEKLDALRERMAARKLVNRANDQPFGQVTFSAGIADVFGYPDRRVALKAADMALYRAKQGGRNRIELASPEDGKPTF